MIPSPSIFYFLFCLLIFRSFSFAQTTTKTETLTRLNDDDPSITWSANWRVGRASNRPVACSELDCFRGLDSNQFADGVWHEGNDFTTVTFPFTGSGIEVYGAISNTLEAVTNVRFIVDGVDQTPFIHHGLGPEGFDEWIYNVPLLLVSGLLDSQHNLIIQQVYGSRLVLDYFQVRNAPSTITDSITLQMSSPTTALSSETPSSISFSILPAAVEDLSQTSTSPSSTRSLGITPSEAPSNSSINSASGAIMVGVGFAICATLACLAIFLCKKHGQRKRPKIASIESGMATPSFDLAERVDPYCHNDGPSYSPTSTMVSFNGDKSQLPSASSSAKISQRIWSPDVMSFPLAEESRGIGPNQPQIRDPVVVTQKITVPPTFDTYPPSNPPLATRAVALPPSTARLLSTRAKSQAPLGVVHTEPPMIGSVIPHLDPSALSLPSKLFSHRNSPSIAPSESFSFEVSSPTPKFATLAPHLTSLAPVNARIQPFLNIPMYQPERRPSLLEQCSRRSSDAGVVVLGPPTSPQDKSPGSATFGSCPGGAYATSTSGHSHMVHGEDGGQESPYAHDAYVLSYYYNTSPVSPPPRLSLRFTSSPLMQNSKPLPDCL